jgi:uncharacterized protein YciI
LLLAPVGQRRLDEVLTKKSVRGHEHGALSIEAASMEFDRFAITLLVQRPDAPVLDEATAGALQDAHMAHIADLHAAGYLLAAGPLTDERFRGLSIFTVDVDRARELKESDPAVVAGLYSVVAMRWSVPDGAISFSPTRFPRSMEDARR